MVSPSEPPADPRPPAARGLLTRRCRCSGDGALDGPAGELGAAAQAGLLADAREVVLDRARRDVQLLADLVVGQAVGDEPQDLELTGGEQRTDRRALAARVAGELAQQVAGELGRDDRAAAVGRDDGLAQLLARRALGQVAGGARRDRVEQALGALVGRDDERPDLGQLATQVLEDDGAAQAGHAQVEHHDVGLELAGEVEPGAAVVGLPDDLDAGVALERADDALTNERMILRDQHADLHALAARAPRRSRGLGVGLVSGRMPDGPRKGRCGIDRALHNVPPVESARQTPETTKTPALLYRPLRRNA